MIKCHIYMHLSHNKVLLMHNLYDYDACYFYDVFMKSIPFRQSPLFSSFYVKLSESQLNI